MNLQSIKTVLESRTVTNPVDRFVLVMLAWHENKNDGACFPSAETLARETGYNKDTIFAAKKRLQVGGFLKVKSGGGRGRANSYELNLETIGQTDSLEDSETIGLTGQNYRPDGLNYRPDTVKLSACSDTKYNEVQPSVTKVELNSTSTDSPNSGAPSESRRQSALDWTSEVLAELQKEFPSIDVQAEFVKWPKQPYSAKALKALRGWLDKAVKHAEKKQRGAERAAAKQEHYTVTNAEYLEAFGDDPSNEGVRITKREIELGNVKLSDEAVVTAECYAEILAAKQRGAASGASATPKQNFKQAVSDPKKTPKRVSAEDLIEQFRGELSDMDAICEAKDSATRSEAISRIREITGCDQFMAQKLFNLSYGDVISSYLPDSLERWTGAEPMGVAGENKCRKDEKGYYRLPGSPWLNGGYAEAEEAREAERVEREQRKAAEAKRKADLLLEAEKIIHLPLVEVREDIPGYFGALGVTNRFKPDEVISCAQSNGFLMGNSAYIGKIGFAELPAEKQDDIRALPF
jgi:hypothetical protein